MISRMDDKDNCRRWARREGVIGCGGGGGGADAWIKEGDGEVL